ncbi:hypothetical protein EMIHUDRAFT_199939 [Emiliania huxleyi CCMP1516]|uniref:Uncharacterized protein n=2 Tax=Emiliania huxleyi TaxID=2903 RepID=A0A0D3KUN7_EMIH1|nr:hypothetical protein EMIHUDRAFT_199939 [Emiliania huxleyi CCMP1516]EOD39472.1 hypothetical protein EMIHUDRAFT_199939 [Emiliania huxleyi CCMP1516]|eukprot:XP_005791901.1 hypothetical protein EMIHUDRAFT_199939 [Emiliania huxleyi CCMP1516]
MSRGRPANLQPAAEAVEVGRLILKAAEWSPQSHELFPEPARLASGRSREARELADVWRGFVLPRRDSE